MFIPYVNSKSDLVPIYLYLSQLIILGFFIFVFHVCLKDDVLPHICGKKKKKVSKRVSFPSNETNSTVTKQISNSTSNGSNGSTVVDLQKQVRSVSNPGIKTERQLTTSKSFPMEMERRVAFK